MINDKRFTVKRRLIERLRDIVVDEESIFGILNYVETTEEQQVLLDFIDEGVDVDVETITVLAIEIDNSRTK